MQKSNPSLSFSKKRLDIDGLYNDESLFDNFSFKTSFKDKINQREIKDDFIYNKPFEDSDISQFNSFKNTFINLREQDLDLNFGEDPYITNKTLMKRINSQYFNNDLKNKVLKYWWSISNFLLFKYEPKNNNSFHHKNNDNKTLELNVKNEIILLFLIKIKPQII